VFYAVLEGKLDRRLFLIGALALSACQTTTNPHLSAGAEQRFVPVENAAALMAIVGGRTVEYTEQSNTGAGIRQTFNRNGTTVYGDQRRVWTVQNGRYCSSADLQSDPSTWSCFQLDVNEAGTIIRWIDVEGTPRNPELGPDTWYGRIL
jgi:hypothetical protein